MKDSNTQRRGFRPTAKPRALPWSKQKEKRKPVAQRPLARVCRTCGVEYPLNEKHFRKYENNTWGMDVHCAPCRRTKDKVARKVRAALEAPYETQHVVVNQHQLQHLGANKFIKTVNDILDGKVSVTGL